tara:strand:- start:1075 stop:2214 length:1140 start_codon:yes stop_codon:yes gene_type:complete
MKIIFILDALRFKSIDILRKNINSKTLCKDVYPPFSFEPDAAYLCGLYPEDSNAGMKIWKKNNYNNNLLFNLLSFIPYNGKLYRQILNKILKITSYRYLKDFNGNIGCIPFNLLKYFELSEKNNLFSKSNKHNMNTIFDFIDSEYSYTGVPFSSGMLNSIKKKFNIKTIKKYKYHFFYISDLDKIGHKYGPDSNEYKLKMKEVTIYINSILKYAEKKDGNVDFLIFGDHGMVNIKYTINIQKILNSLDLQVETDYIYFLDSTVARFWFLNERAKNKIIDSLSNNQFGDWVSKEDKEKYRINYNHNRYGDATWWANDGVLISPNFWQSSRKLKGMHGYRNNSLDNHTCVVTNRGDLFDYKKNNSIDMVSLNKIILKFLTK